VKPIVIVGGGLSGLAAAVSLTSQSLPVILLEQRPFLGGRTYSFRDATTGEDVDNGQHLLIAGYARTFAYLRAIGTEDLVSVQSMPRLIFHHPTKGFRQLRIPPLPAPFHLTYGVLMSNFLPLGDRWKLLRAGRLVHETLEAGKDMTIAEWLDLAHQSPESRLSFWEPLAVSVMNERVGTASALVFLRSLRDAFLATWSAASLALSAVGLSDLFVHPAAEYVRRRGGKISCNADVVGTEADAERVLGVRLRDGTTVEGGAVILTVPSNRVRALLPSRIADSEMLRGISEVPVSPIICLHLWYDQNFMPQPVVGLVGRRTQWVFNRTLFSRYVKSGGDRISAVISAAHDEVGHTNQDLITSTTDDLAGIYGPAARTVRNALVIREKRATFSLSPDVERLRPGPSTPMRNLFFAGDWTATGYPATVEGAIRSGEAAAVLAAASLRG
jgi:zeta-carotene desaturase